MTGAESPSPARAERGRSATIAERSGLVLLGVVLALVIAEGALQIGAAYVRRTAYDRPDRWTGRSLRILCVGDSNTYGTFVPRQDTYPAVLERLWNGQAGGPEVDVVNLGVPGTNSSKLRNNFRSLLASLRPDIVLVLVGANDLWTTPAPAADEKEPTLEQRLWQRSRVFRLLYMIRRAVSGFAPPEPEVIVKGGESDQDARGTVRVGTQEFDLTWTGKAKTRPHDWARALRVHLNAMRSAAAESGVELVLLTYASERAAYGMANAVIRSVRAADLPVIDVASAFQAICREAECGDLFFPSGHPTRSGYQVVAATVWRELARLGGRPAQPPEPSKWNEALDPAVSRLLAASPESAPPRVDSSP